MHNIDYINCSFLDNLSEKEKKKYDHYFNEKINLVTKGIKSASDYYKIFSRFEDQELIKESNKIADQISDKYENVIVVGMGGAHLNPAMVTSFLQYNYDAKINVKFIYNTDPFFIKSIIDDCDLSKTAVITISNSGNTLETISIISVLIDIYKNIHKIKDFNKNFYFCTNMQTSNKLVNLAKEIKANIFEHETNISGRYSSFTNIILILIKLVYNLDPAEYLQGAKLVIDQFMQEQVNSMAFIGAKNIFMSNKSNMVNIGYLQNFQTILSWYEQIIAESLGKKGKGYMPITGLGPNSQHSMFQLFLEGAGNNFFSFFILDEMEKSSNSNLKTTLDYHDILQNISGKNIFDINNVNYEASLFALNAQKNSIRTIKLKDLTLHSLGGLVGYLALEVIILGHLIEVNPFNQNGVELIKNKSRELMHNLYSNLI